MADRESLILRSERQQDLGLHVPAGAPPMGCERDGVYTGERLFQRDPTLYRLIASRLATGDGILAIAQDAGVHPYSVLSIRDRERLPIEIERRGLAALVRGAARMAAEVVAQAIWDVIEERRAAGTRLTVRELRDLTVSVGILTQRGEEMSERGAGESMPVGDRAPGTEEELRSWIAGQMDLGGERGREKGGGAKGGGAEGSGAISDAVSVGDGAGSGIQEGKGVVDVGLDVGLGAAAAGPGVMEGGGVAQRAGGA